ncbi:MAG: winged helix-turn-helix transcriptional regulator [Kosmotogaceae bacterium]|nr:winged helix-turn-helix transcriptional regulator [Kosmotogaceae bacterium]
MNTLERVKIRFGRPFDFLPSIYRLTNNERLAKHFEELTPGYRPVGELAEWVRTTKKNLPGTILEKMSLYFDWKAPLGMRISPVMSEESFESVQVLLQKIASISPKDMIKDFLLIGLGPRSVGYDEVIVERILEDQKEALVFLAEKAVFTPQQKAVMLDFISDPEKMKEDYLHLLQWYEEHVYSHSPYDGKRLKESCEYLERNLSTYGNDYLLKLTDNLHYEELDEDRKILLVLSYFIENAQGGIFHPRAETDVFIVGFNFVSSVLERDSISIASRRYGALSNPNRIRLLNALFGKRLTGYELSRAMKLSNAELTEAFSALVACGLVKTFRLNDRIIFTAEKDEVIKMLTCVLDGPS